ncbi:MAG: type II toxin-antitoxin system RelE/ParE family toxin [Candidatus Cloacimonetes bacterium]|nr:type II toxin-antitoxin system RelE/ParE family toxin [Candidatus Cloacimonadota bacterium]
MKIDFLDVAEDEFIDTIAYYNQQSEGLGYEFAAEVKRTISRIVKYPKAWPPLSKRTRRCRTNRFPYGVIYQVRDEKILIIGIMHLHKDPQRWKDRIQSLKS